MTSGRLPSIRCPAAGGWVSAKEHLSTHQCGNVRLPPCTHSCFEQSFCSPLPKEVKFHQPLRQSEKDGVEAAILVTLWPPGEPRGPSLVQL